MCVILELAAVIERRHGGVEACFKPRSANKAEGTIAEGSDYEARFGMAKSRFVELTTCLRFTEPQTNTAEKVIFLLLYIMGVYTPPGCTHP